MSSGRLILIKIPKGVRRPPRNAGGRDYTEEVLTAAQYSAAVGEPAAPYDDVGPLP